MKSTIKKELLGGKSLFDWGFLCLGLVLQIVTYLITKDSTLSFISGLAGVFSVVLCSQKKISSYFFGFIQLFTYVALCFQQNLYGEIGENIFYFITMVVGIIVWAKHYENVEVESRKLSSKGWILLTILCVVCSLLLGMVLDAYTNDTQPYLDAFSTIPAFIAQILLVTRYREQWVFWLIVDVTTGILWLRAGNYCMVVQYIFWIANCVYGYKKWSK